MSSSSGLPPVVIAPDLGHAVIPGGWTARQGFVLPRSPRDLSERRWVCVGTVNAHPDMGAAIEALHRGVALVVVLRLASADRLDFLEDLHRAGTVIPGGEQYLLDADQRAVLALLAEGSTVTAAARATGMSARTAHRRLADARRRLGVDSTTAALLERDAISKNRVG